ncbi:MAG: hypothetical protein ACYC9R_13250 [Nitrosotalea sp.]
MEIKIIVDDSREYIKFIDSDGSEKEFVPKSEAPAPEPAPAVDPVLVQDPAPAPAQEPAIAPDPSAAPEQPAPAV